MRYINGNTVDVQLTPKEIEAQWERFLEGMTKTHREECPDDPRSTPALCEFFMQNLLKKGFVEQNDDGVYLLPPIIFVGN